jgi:hypothetical protein
LIIFADVTVALDYDGKPESTYPKYGDGWSVAAHSDGGEYSYLFYDNAILTITPEPDSVLRVFMAFKPLFAPIMIEPQQLTPFERKGFTVVEWGGSIVR